MKSRKNILRIGTFLAILMFLLIPLLSSPVAAAFFYNSTAVTCIDVNGVLTADADCPPPYIFQHSGTPTATFTCDYTFTDSYSNGVGSQHRATITVVGPGTPTGGAVGSTGWVVLNPGAGTSTGTISVGPFTYTAPPPSVTWTVEVVADCQVYNVYTSTAYPGTRVSDTANAVIVCQA